MVNSAANISSTQAIAKSKYVYVALIRGINVGGSFITMEKLRKMFISSGFPDAVTYIQSGNVLFTSTDGSVARLASSIEKNLSALLGKTTTVFVFSPEDLKNAAARNPFAPEKFTHDERCHLMFLSAAPDAARRRALMALQGEEYRFHIEGKVLYYMYEKKFAGNRRTINFEKILGVAGTARTWKVVNKLIVLSKDF